MHSPQLDSRSQQIIKLLVSEYLRGGEPVGSRTIAKKLGFDLSPATIRNGMMDLEDMGLIRSVHTSSGRIPTAKGILHYVRYLMNFTKPNLATVGQLSEAMNAASASDLASSAADLVARLAKGIVIVTVPSASASPVTQLKLVRLSSCRAMAMIVTEIGEVSNRLIEISTSFSDRDLESAARYFNEHFAGQTLNQASLVMRKHMSGLRERIAVLLRRMLSTVADGSGAPDMYTAGENEFFTHPDLVAGSAQLRRLIAMLREKERIQHLLESSLQARDVEVRIGVEAFGAGLDNCVLVVSSYGAGAIGFIGSLRTKYSRVVPLIDLSGRLMSDAMGRIRHALN